VRKNKIAKITDAVEILKRRLGIDPQTDPEMLEVAEEFRIAQVLYDARVAAGLPPDAEDDED
jgi:hypothetical protein